MNPADLCERVESLLVERLDDKEAEQLAKLERAFAVARERLAAAIAQRRRDVASAALRVDDLRAQIDRWQQRAEQAVADGDDAQAREALRRRLRLTSDVTSTQAVAETQRAEVAELERLAKRCERRAADVTMRRGIVERAAKRAASRAPDDKKKKKAKRAAASKQAPRTISEELEVLREQVVESELDRIKKR